MNKTWKALCALLALLMLSTACLASCKKEAGPVETETTTATQGEDPELEAPPTKFLSRDFKFYGLPTDDTYDYMIDPDGYNGDYVNDAVFKRNVKIEELFDIDIISQFDDEDPSTDLLMSKTSGDYLCDVFVFYASAGINRAAEGLYVDVMNLPTINTDRDYWDQAFFSEFTKNGHCYQLTGDIEESDEMHQILLAMNQRIFSEQFPHDDIVETVKNKEWTIEKFMSLYKDYGLDSDGNGMPERLGFGYDYYSVSYFLISSGIKTLVYDDETKKANMDDITSTRAVDVIDKIKPIFTSTSVDTKMVGGTFGYDVAYGMFSSGNTFFQVINVMDYFSSFTEMTDKMLFLPFPMYDNTQTEYRTPAHNSFLPFAIPSSNTEEDVADIGMVLESMAYYSAPVTEAMYDITIQFKMPQTPEARELLILTFESRFYDFDYISGVSGLRDNLAQLVNKNQLGIYFSAMSGNKKSMCKKFETLLATY